MDSSRVSQGELIAGASGLLLFLFLFLDWAGVGEITATGWQSFDITDVLLAVIGLGAAALAVAKMAGTNIVLPGRPGFVLFLGAYAAFVITLVSVLEGENKKIGVWLALLAAIGLLYGAWQAANTTSRPANTGPATPGP